MPDIRVLVTGSLFFFTVATDRIGYPNFRKKIRVISAERNFKKLAENG